MEKSCEFIHFSVAKWQHIFINKSNKTKIKKKNCQECHVRIQGITLHYFQYAFF